jgi:hypothetical protein
MILKWVNYIWVLAEKLLSDFGRLVSTFFALVIGNNEYASWSPAEAEPEVIA